MKVDKLKSSLIAIIEQQWYGSLTWGLILFPLSLVFYLIVKIRQYLYRNNYIKSYSLPKPVLIVGNISIGGSGKTPVLMEIINLCKNFNIKVGVISRGYKGSYREEIPVAMVDLDNPRAATIYGDEPCLIAYKTGVPVCVANDRVLAGKHLLEHTEIDLILSDDGLQHYSLKRDLEILMVDQKRKFGNKFVLPMGPLREPISRLNTVDLVINENLEQNVVFNITHANSIVNKNLTLELATLSGITVHAVCAISNPHKFYQALRDFKINVIEHSFSDHYPLQIEDITFNDEHIVLLTEKDAIKCLNFATSKHFIVPLLVVFAPATLEAIGCMIKNKVYVR